MSAIGYYPGCSLGGSAPEYDASVRAVAARLNVQLQEIDQWVCCGASFAHSVDRHLALSLAADSLAKARRAGMQRVLAPCAMCYQRLATAAHEMRHRPDLCAELTQALGEAKGAGIENVEPLSLLNWLEQLPAGAIKSAVSKPLKGLKIACYYGCLLLRPGTVTGAKEVEAPRSMENILIELGATPVRWSMATECCGGSFALSRKSVVIRQCRRIYDAAISAGADVLCMACPMCHNNLDMRQKEYAGGEKSLPMMYLTQLVGLALGISSQELGLGKHFVPVEAALAAV